MIKTLLNTPHFSRNAKVLGGSLLFFPVGWLAIKYITTTETGACNVMPLFLYAAAYIATFVCLYVYSQHKLQDMILVDPLTKTYNNRFFFKALDVEFAKSKRNDQPLSVVHFTIVNARSLAKELGKTPDYIHRTFSEIVASAIRTTDIFSRIDQNNYTLLLTNTDEVGAQVLARRLDAQVMSVFRKIKSTIPDAIAFGICSTGFEKCNSAIEIFDKATKALDAARGSERNRIMSCTDGDCGPSVTVH